MVAVIFSQNDSTAHGYTRRRRRRRGRTPTARAGGRRFWLVSACAPYIKAPYRIDLLWRTLRAAGPDRPEGQGGEGRADYSLEEYVLHVAVGDGADLPAARRTPAAPSAPSCQPCRDLEGEIHRVDPKFAR